MSSAVQLIRQRVTGQNREGTRSAVWKEKTKSIGQKQDGRRARDGSECISLDSK